MSKTYGFNKLDEQSQKYIKHMVRWSGYNPERDNVDGAEIRFYHPVKKWQVINWRSIECVVMHSSKNKRECEQFIKNKAWKTDCFDNAPTPTHCPFCDVNYYISDKCPVCGETG